MIGKGGLILLLFAATATLGACTEDPIFADNSETAPGFSTPTIEVVLEAAELPSWRDTTYWGFVLPSSAAFSLLADAADLSARQLGRFSNLPDSVFVDTARVAIDSFATAGIRVSIDTLLSELPAGEVEVAVWSLARSFDADRASWRFAGPGDLWSTPGGDLETLLGADTLSFEPDSLGLRPDSIFVRLSGNVD